MELIRNFKVRHLVNILLGVWIASWVYFAALNWEIFTVRVNINMGFAIWSTYPFLLFALVGIVIILSVRYLLHYSRMLRKIEVKEKNDKIRMQDNDIEILKLREMLYKMQASEHSKTVSHLDELHEKIDGIARQFEASKNSGSEKIESSS